MLESRLYRQALLLDMLARGRPVGRGLPTMLEPGRSIVIKALTKEMF